MHEDNKILVVFFSSSGVTRSVANKLSATLDATTTELIPKKNSIFGLFIRTLLGVPADINTLKEDVSAYDLVIVASPVWTARIPAPVCAFLSLYSAKCQKLAFVCTQNSEGANSVLKRMEKTALQTPLDTLILSKTDLDDELITDNKITRFCRSCITYIETLQKPGSTSKTPHNPTSGTSKGTNMPRNSITYSPQTEGF